MPDDRRKRIEALLREARACAPDRRDQVLADLAERDPDLVSEVRARLAGADSDGSTPAANGLLGADLSTYSDSDPDPSAVIDHGQFPPGTVLAGRYRVVNLVGRGGMGEVYRADDLRLSQAVALKFLPPAVAREPARLARLNNEVRVARDVSHPNVCRVYDIAEHRGQAFLTMEFVNGEDLSASLTRLGRPTEERAVAIAREICAGLAAAHDRGVIHRDLKPSNVMLDRAGRVRLMDFGIAVIADRPHDVAGTPAYMAPEQLEGRPATVQSDVYALGLVLYELFAGRRAIVADSFEARRLRPSHDVVPPSTIVRSMSPPVEHAILACLDPDPANRPVSVRAVDSLLEHVDPLATGRGEATPAPELLLRAGQVDRAVAPRMGWLWIVGLMSGLLLASWAGTRATVAGLSGLATPLDVLTDDARDVRGLAGLGPAAGEARGLVYDRALVTWASARGLSIDRDRLPAVKFWMRGGSGAIEASSPTAPPSAGDPPLALPGDSLVEFDTAGRLLRFRSVPSVGASDADPGWPVWFALAGLDITSFARESSADRDGSAVEIWREIRTTEGRGPRRVTAVTRAGRVEAFSIDEPWAALETPSDVRASVAASISAAISIALVLVAVGLAVVNVQRMRVDREGLVRVALSTFVLWMIQWVASPGHSADLGREAVRLYYALGFGLLYAVVIGGTYVGLEPFVRRYWPRALLGWTRLVRGRLTDPLVGRDVLAGLTMGLLGGLLIFVYQLLPAAVGWTVPAGWLPPLPAVDGLSPAVAALAHSLNWSLINGFFALFVVAVIRHFVGRIVIAALLAMIVFALLGDGAMTTELGRPVVFLTLALSTLPGIVALVRYGLLAGVAAAFSANAITNTVFSLDRSHALSDVGLLHGGVIVGLGLWSWRIALGRTRGREGPAPADR